jgi:uncharacterized protein YndB with AHSA1/START domain
MTAKEKPARTQELFVDIDAPLGEAWKALTTGPGLANWFAPIGEVSAPGAGAEVKMAWSEEMAITTKVDAWEPGKLVRWRDECEWMGPGLSLATDWLLSTENGKTRVRMVQSGFGESEGWDSLFDGTEIGWRYFLQNLRIYLELHPGRTRRMISERPEVTAPREAFWKHLLSAKGGIVSGASVTPKAGDTMRVQLGDHASKAVVELAVENRALALRLTDLGDALLFIELEGSGSPFHAGFWFSVYDGATASRVESAAKKAFKEIVATAG